MSVCRGCTEAPTPPRTLDQGLNLNLNPFSLLKQTHLTDFNVKTTVLTCPLLSSGSRYIPPHRHQGTASKNSPALLLSIPETPRRKRNVKSERIRRNFRFNVLSKSRNDVVLNGFIKQSNKGYGKRCIKHYIQLQKTYLAP